MPNEVKVGIVGIGIYLPKTTINAKEISEATNGVWSEEAVYEKLGIKEKRIASDGDGTQEMAYLAAKDLVDKTGFDPLKIDVILNIGEEWKEYPLTTSALYVQDKIGAINAWGIDVQNRCSTFVSALKIAKDMLVADQNIHTILIVGGYRNGDFVDYSDPNMSMMFNLGAGGGAMLLQKGYHKNLVLESHIIADGSLSRTAGVVIGGTVEPITHDNLDKAYKSLRLMDAQKMKDRLNEVSFPNWLTCIDQSLFKSRITRKDLNYLAILHIKRSGHLALLNELGLSENQTVYLEDYGHIGQIDQILSLHLGLESGKIKDGDHICLLSAGIGYVWASSIVRWG